MSTESFLPEDVKRGKRLALVVGVDHVPGSLLPSLRSARQDAEAMAQVLEKYCHFTLLEPPLLDGQATSAAVKKAILRLARKRNANDFLFFYFSGHGQPRDVEAGRSVVYLGTQDFEEIQTEEDETLHLSLSWLRDKLYIQTQAGKVLLVLDCCYSGEMGRTGSDPYLEDLRQRIAHYFDASMDQNGIFSSGLRLALTATGHNASAQESQVHGLMTELMLPPLRGEVPEILGSQGHLALKSLSNYLDEQYNKKGVSLPSLSGDFAGQYCILANFPMPKSHRIPPLSTQGLHNRPSSYLPFPRNPQFQSRLGEFEALEDMLFPSGPSSMNLRLIGVTGMGGVGKTQLAVEIAYRYQHRFPDGIFWIPAAGRDPSTWQQALAELALKIDYLPPGDNPAHPEVYIRRARYLCRYFASHSGALIILDNVEIPQQISTILPDLAGGTLYCQLLYTSRRQTHLTDASIYTVAPLSQEGAWRILLESTRSVLLQEMLAGGKSIEANAVRTVCQLMDYLPLALMHLQRLLAEDRYLQVQNILDALLRRGALSLAHSQNQLPSLEETFLLSWQQVGEERTRQCFLLASLFPEAVPIPLWLLGLATGLGESALPFDPLWEVCLRLQDTSLLEILSEGQVRLHSLVRIFGQHLLQQLGEKSNTLRIQAADRLTAVFCDLTLLEQRVQRIGYWICLEQIRVVCNYASNLSASHAKQLIHLERAIDHESYLLADNHWWPEPLPALFYQQLFNRAVETGDTFSWQQSPSRWIQQMESIGATNQTLLRILSGHTDSVESATFSPDGQLVLTSSLDNTARLWESNTGTLRAILSGHTDSVESATFSPDGQLVLTGSLDNTARLWESNTGALRAILQGHTDSVSSVAFSPDGQLAITGSYDNTARLWESNTGTLYAVLQGHTGRVNSVAFSPDGQLAITGSLDNTARLWESNTGTLRAILQGHTDSVSSVAFSPDGRMVLTSSRDNTARLWENRTGILYAILQGHTDSVSSVAFSPDGRLVLTGSRDNTARLWERETGILHATLQGHTGRVKSVAFSPDGQLVLTGSYDNTARLWESHAGTLYAILQGHISWVNSVAFSPDGQLILTGSLDNTARLWERNISTLHATLQGHTDAVSNAIFSPDGRMVLTGSYDDTARLWESHTGNMHAILQGHTDSVGSVAFSPDGRMVLTGSYDDTARLWESHTGNMHAILQGHTDSVSSVTFSPDGRMVLTGSYDNTARLWESHTGALRAILQGHTGRISSVAFSPDGKMVLTGSYDNTARLWESHTGALRAILQGHKSLIENIAFSPDGQMVLTGSLDNTARLWESHTGALRAILQGHTGRISSVAFSPDGKMVLTGSSDNTARLWESHTGALRAILQGYTDSVSSVAFSPNGQLVFSSDDNGRTLFWDIRTMDAPHLLGLYVTADCVSSLSWQNTTQLHLVDLGAKSGRPFVYHLHLQGLY